MLKTYKTSWLNIMAKSFVFAVLIMIALGYLFGYKAILVNGWSAEPDIHYKSLIITAKTQLSDLKKGDYITTSLSGNSLLTHELIAVNYDGLWKYGDYIEISIKGEDHFMYLGYYVDKPKTDENKDNTINENVETNIITMQTSNDLDANKEYRIYSNSFVGKVIYSNYMIGSTIYLIKGNMLILFGLFGLIVLLFIIKEQYSSNSEYN